MTCEPTFTYDLATFSADGTTIGPWAQSFDAAAEYLSQRMADQHRGTLTAVYWHRQAARLLSEAELSPGIELRRKVLRARGVIVTAIVATPAAAFSVSVFPVFDDGSSAEKACATARHARLSIALGEAGGRAEAWLRQHSDTAEPATGPGPVVAFTVAIDGSVGSTKRSKVVPSPGADISEPSRRRRAPFLRLA
jgi:hypothetical protein